MIYLLVGLLAGGIITVSITKWSFLKDDFFKIKLIEILQIITTLSIALFITFFIGTKINYDIKKKEIFVGLLERFKKDLSEVFSLINEYINIEKDDMMQTRGEEKKILVKFTELSCTLAIIVDPRYKDLIKEQEYLLKAFIQFKAVVTDNPFGSQKTKFLKGKDSVISEKYRYLLRRVYNTTLLLYS